MITARQAAEQTGYPLMPYIDEAEKAIMRTIREKRKEVFLDIESDLDQKFIDHLIENIRSFGFECHQMIALGNKGPDIKVPVIGISWEKEVKKLNKK